MPFLFLFFYNLLLLPLFLLFVDFLLLEEVASSKVFLATGPFLLLVKDGDLSPFKGWIGSNFFAVLTTSLVFLIAFFCMLLSMSASI